MRPDDLVEKATSIISKCSETKTVINDAKKSFDAFEKELKSLNETDAKLVLLYDREIAKMLATLERIDGKVEYIEDLSKSIKQLTNAEKKKTTGAPPPRHFAR